MERTPLTPKGVDYSHDTTMDDDYETTMEIKCDHYQGGKNEKSANQNVSVIINNMKSKNEKSAYQNKQKHMFIQTMNKMFIDDQLSLITDEQSNVKNGKNARSTYPTFNIYGKNQMSTTTPKKGTPPSTLS